MMKPDNVIRIPCTLDNDFFVSWFTFFKPFNDLTDKEVSVAAAIAKHRYLLSKKITDEDLLNEVLFSEDTRKKIREELKMVVSHFRVMISNLRKKNVIVNNKLNPSFLPNIIDEGNGVSLLLYFDFTEKKIDAI